jgi:hypothetical protein
MILAIVEEAKWGQLAGQEVQYSNGFYEVDLGEFPAVSSRVHFVLFTVPFSTTWLTVGRIWSRFNGRVVCSNEASENR